MDLSASSARRDQGGTRPPTSRYSGPFEVVLVDVGTAPPLVAHVLRSVMNLTLTDPQALEEALPLVLLQSAPRALAEGLGRKLRLAGASVELRVPRPRSKGFRPSSVPRRAA